MSFPVVANEFATIPRPTERFVNGRFTGAVRCGIANSNLAFPTASSSNILRIDCRHGFVDPLLDMAVDAEVVVAEGQAMQLVRCRNTYVVVVTRQGNVQYSSRS